jgi:hypothetical protein
VFGSPPAPLEPPDVRTLAQPTPAYPHAVDYEQGWAVLCRDTGILDGDQLNVVEVLTVHLTESAAAAEVERLRSDDPDPDHFYYRVATKIARG